MIKFCSLLLLILLSGKLAAQTDQIAKDLFNEIAKIDSIFFDAFNKKDIENQKTFISGDIEFYHDKGGLTHYDEFIGNSIKNFENNKDVRRYLVPGSLEVYLIKDYGAVQIGKHKFCRPPYNEENCETFKFIHLWKKDKGGWILTRVISYDH